MNNHSKYLLGFLLIFTTKISIAQREGNIESTEIQVEKDRKAFVPDAIKPKAKASSIKIDAGENNSITFDIADRKANLGMPKFNPLAQNYVPQDTTVIAYENFLKLGVGNYGRLYAEGLASTPSSYLGIATLYFKHNSANKGPVLNELSANGQTAIALNGKYVSDRFKLDGNLGYDRNNFYFYGFKNIPNREVKKADIQQTLNKYNFNIGFENTDREAPIDYAVKTGIDILDDNFTARELVWGTKANFTLPVTKNFYALVHSQAFVTQRTDSVSNTRNLFKIRPTFILRKNAFALTFGLNVASERDVQKDISKNINRTKAFPVVNIDYQIAPALQVFVGYEGDIYRNSLQSFLLENPWLQRKQYLLNTEKSADVFGGLKGDLASGFNYDIKLSYARFKDFAVFNNTAADTSKFEVLYDTGVVDNFKVNANIYYKYNEIWRSTLKVETNTYGMDKLPKPYHLPTVRSTWSNTLAFSQKLFIGTDVYFMSGTKAFNAISKQDISLKSIFDLNAKMNYQFSRHLSSFVYLNNIMGNSYQRYNYYPLQSLNFLVGLSYGFSTQELF